MMDYYRVDVAGQIAFVQASSKEEAVTRIRIDNQIDQDKPARVTLCDKPMWTVKGKMKDCCKDPVNLDWVSNGTDQRMAMCRICHARHFHLTIDPMRVGVAMGASIPVDPFEPILVGI
jgi:hypothetical protein